MAKYAPIYMSVYDGPDFVLGNLTLSTLTFEDSAQVGDVIATIDGMAETDSTLEIIEGGDAFEIDGDELKLKAVQSAGTITLKIQETNNYATNSPKVTEFSIEVTAAG